MRAQFGVVIPQGWRLDLPDVSAAEQFSLITKLAVVAEELGFDSIWLYDHFHTIPKVEIKSCFECWTTLTALAAKTRNVGLGQIVTCNSYRNPAHLAKIASVLDVASNGRLEFGIGAGWYDNEYEAYGIPFEKPSVRIGRLAEAVKIIKKMWVEDRTTFHGRYYNIEGAINFPKPIQKPRPSILIGGEGEQLLLRVVAEMADQCNFNGPLEHYRKKLDVLAKHCAHVNRNFDEIGKTILTDVVIRRTPDEVEAFLRKMEAAGVLNFKYLGGSRWEQASLQNYRDKNVVGTPTECVQQLKRFQEIGVESFKFYFPLEQQEEAMRLFADQVMPKLK
jgi:F420-dependent oxidoreductase-like protein